MTGDRRAPELLAALTEYCDGPIMETVEEDLARLLESLDAAGYVIVPKEPTHEMRDRGESSLICGPLPDDLDDAPSISWAHATSCYRAMIAASAEELQR